VPAVLASLSDEVEWEAWADNRAQAAGVPWLAPRSDAAGVGEFFSIVGSMELHDFQVLDLLASGNQVAAEIEIEVTVPETGKRIRDQEMHLWTLDGDGRITGMRHYVDTLKQADAAGVLAAGA
jgi:ketosteroid isomerase-like protein